MLEEGEWCIPPSRSGVECDRGNGVLISTAGAIVRVEPLIS